MTRTSKSQGIIVCIPKALPPEMWVDAARTATEINPINHPPIERLVDIMPGPAQIPLLADVPEPLLVSVLTTKYWYTDGVHLTVGFLDNPPAQLRKRILSHMNAWGQTADVTFVETATDAQVRIARTEEKGHWSYVGVDIMHIDRDKPTMNLESFTMETPEAEYRRVVRHETGHTLGFPHEHMRRELVNLIDPAKAISFYQEFCGWSAEKTRLQVLTPLEEGSLYGTPHADPNSIMCYQIPAAVTTNGEPIVGGLDIDPSDYEFVAKFYPKSSGAPAAVPAKPAGKRRQAKTSSNGGRAQQRVRSSSRSTK